MLTLEQIEDIRSSCFADDLDIDLERMQFWSAQRVQEFFESGGDAHPHLREAEMIRLGMCMPNAQIPADTRADAAPMGSLKALGSASTEALPGSARIFCVSDLHTDHEANLEWCRALRATGSFVEDVLIIAGDVTVRTPYV